MPLIAKNQVVVSSKVEEKQPPKKVEAVVVEPKPAPVAKKEPVEHKESAKKGISLTVDGKQRKVSKNSTYLLDMLTLDDQ